MKIKEYIKQAHDTAVEKGFYECGECGGKDNKYWYGVCECGWHGTSDKSSGGNAIADTGDYSDVVCPDCYKPLDDGDCPSCNGTGKTQNKNIGELLMLVVSELGEALEAHRKFGIMHINIDNVLFLKGDEFKSHFECHCKDSFQDEIADVFIRLFDLCGYSGIEPEYLPGLTIDSFDNVAEQLLEYVGMVYEIKKYESYNKSMSWRIAELFQYLEYFCQSHNIPIEKHIEAKMMYNKTRPKKHGKEY